MVDDPDDDDFIDPDEPELADLPRLQLVSRFARMVPKVGWFSALGVPLSAAEQQDALDYLSALGFPDARVAPVADWEEAEVAIRNPDWNTEWWEAEEQLRAGLIAQALTEMPEEDLLVALTNVTSRSSEPVLVAAAAAALRAGIGDEALVRAAAGSASQACYQAALVLAAGEDETHPFAIKYRLFEAGHWPLGIVGSTFNLL